MRVRVVMQRDESVFCVFGKQGLVYRIWELQKMRQKMGDYTSHLVGEETGSERVCNVLRSHSQRVLHSLHSLSRDGLFKRRRHHHQEVSL